MKKNNKFIPYIISICFLAFGFIAFYLITDLPSKSQDQKTLVVQTPIDKDIKTNTSGAYRKIASIPASKRAQKKFEGRHIIGNIPATGDIAYSNKVTKDWDKKYLSDLKRMSQTALPKSIKIKKQKSYVKFKNNIGRYLEHVLVTMEKSDGSPYSFEALIDSETGSMIRSWNKTRYEFKDKTQIDFRGKAVTTDEI